MNYRDILLIIAIIIFFYNMYELNRLKKKNIEGFDATNDIKIAVKNIYLADVEAIRSLSDLAIKLFQGNATISGNCVITGDFTVNTFKSNTNISTVGNITGGNITTGGNLTTGNTITGGNINTGNITGGNINTSGNINAGHIVLKSINITG